MPIAIVPASFTVLDTGEFCAGLVGQRPRFILCSVVLERTRRHIETEPLAKKLFGDLIAHCERLMAVPALESGEHGASRQVLDRVVSLAALFQITREEKYAVRATRELLASAKLPHWHPESFLSVAERSLALVLGLDWLDERLTEAERTAIEDGLLANGLRAYANAYACLPWWHRDAANWNIVCNSSAIMTGLALHHRERRLAEQVIAMALAGLPNALASFAPDGAWAEGPGYWAFAMRYLTTLMDSLDTALPGAKVGEWLASMPGLREAAYFRMACEGPTHKLFNFADSYEDAPVDPSLFSLALRYHLPAAAHFNRERLQKERLPGYFGAHARALLYFTSMGGERDLALLPLDGHFAAHDVATFRSSFTDAGAMYLAVKGGHVQTPHGHADLGSFVLDAKGHRFLMDLGPDFYDLPGFWNGRPNTDGKRWQLQRTATFGHNALLVNHAGQNPLASAHITHFESRAERGMCTIDLTEAYAHQAMAEVTRRFEFDRAGKQVTMVDAIRPTGAVQATQHFHTEAEVELRGNVAMLKIQGETIAMRFECEAPFMLRVEEVVAEPQAKPMENVRRVIFHATAEGVVELRCRIDCA